MHTVPDPACSVEPATHTVAAAVWAALLAVLASTGAAAEPGADHDAPLLQTARMLSTALAAGDCDTDAAQRFAQTLAVSQAGPSAPARSVLRAAAAAPQVCEAELRDALAQLRRADDRSAAADADAATLLEGLAGHPGFRFEPGDVLLLRSAELLSSAVSQVGVHHAFFSHAAIVGLDPVWDAMEVVESVVDEGMRTQSLDDWLDRPYVRFAVWRPSDAALGRRAAVAAHADAAARRGDARRYDFALSLDDPAQLYCSEVITRAYALAAPDAPRVPARPSSVGALLHGFPLAVLGMRSSEVFLPDDVELDGRFEPVLELRAPQRVAQIEAMDSAVRRLFDGLRGADRERVLAAIDRETPAGPAVLPYALRGSYAAYRQLPDEARGRLVGLVRLVSRELETGSAGNRAAAGAAKPWSDP